MSTVTATSAIAPVKHQVVDKLPKKFKNFKFGVQSNQDIVNHGVIEISDRAFYDVERAREPAVNGVLDKRLGTSSKTGICSTCNQRLNECIGHFGYVRLPLPAFHIGYIKFTMKILQEICKDCSRVLIVEADKRQFLKELRNPGIDNMKRVGITKRINEQCRKTKHCPYCKAVNGQIRKIGPLKLVHDKFVAFNKSTSAKKQPPPSKIEFDNSFAEARKHVNDLDKHIRKACEDLNPLRVFNLFKQISPDDCELLGINPAEGRPEQFLWTYLPAPPVCIRPSVVQDGGQSNEDDISSRLSDIVFACGLIRAALQTGKSLSTLMEQWEFLQLQIALYVNSDVPGVRGDSGVTKTVRGFCQRLKGKQGRFRGNLSGKRVDFSGRTVISPDPNLAVNQVAVPVLVAKNLTYPERAHRESIAKLRQCIINGPNVWPGAQGVIKMEGEHNYRVSLKFGDKAAVAKDLRIGDVVERHLEDGDIVLFNRQPSLHKLSIMSHLVKVRPWRTFRLNECVCGPYNADFDGDEMNLHVPQTEEARAEAFTLMGVKHNLATPKNGEPIIAATQDFITAAYLLSNKDNFFDRRTFTYIVMHMMDGVTHLDLPPPAIMAPKRLWTGKQIFSMLLRPNKASSVLINLDAKCIDYQDPPPPLPGHRKRAPDMCPNDGWLVVRNSEVMCGRMDKSTVGAGKKDSIFYVILRDYGPDATVTAMNRLAKLCARMLTNRGFSLGIGDVFPTTTLTQAKNSLIEDAYAEADNLIKQFNENKLEKSTGCTMEETLEAKISGILSRVRQQAGELCIRSLSPNNAPWVMASSGSKGSKLNVAQMIAAVGQQIIAGARVADGFQDRTLPHFHKNTRHALAKGFVWNSFYTGLVPTEFLFHAISGREGLVDTAVKTAETGYMSRRLMKSLEDLSTKYDDTVRTSSDGVVQFQFGGDKLDPVDMEGKAVPVNFARTFSNAENLTWSNADRALLPFEILALCDSILKKERNRYRRRGLLKDEPLSYTDTTDYGVDEHEGGRNFLETIEEHVHGLAKKFAQFRVAVGLEGMMTQPETSSKTLTKEENRSLVALETEIEATRVKQLARLDPSKEQNPAQHQPRAKLRYRTLTYDNLLELQPVLEELNFKRPFKPKTTIEKQESEKISDLITRLDKVQLSYLSRLACAIESREAGLVSKTASERAAKVSEKTLRHFIGLCLEKYSKAHVEPGHAVGAVGAQSIGEPGTQMTLKTFHFAGVAGMSITQGVPRIKEIINASKTISTPVITCPLQNPYSLQVAKIVRARIEKTYIEDVLRFLDDEWQPHRAFITLHINTEVLDNMHLGLSLHDIVNAIVKQKKLKLGKADMQVFDQDASIEITVRPLDLDSTAKRSAKTKAATEALTDLSVRISQLKRILPSVPISGYPDATRAIVQRDENEKNTVLVEGYGLRHCMNTEGVVGTRTTTNGVMECKEVLGIEAARTTIAKEISDVMNTMNIDPRHMQLLADLMTYKGDVLGITRFGLSKMRDSVLQLASFEKTADHLFDAASGLKTDPIEGVSEKIIMGETMSVGTGAFQVVRRLGLNDEHFTPLPTVFEDAWNEEIKNEVKAKREKKRVL